ncbi:MAG: DUF637 domain-containing protein, partial [Oceanisphaera sp.]|uniref:DUF637 domain-containing protein n=1 Tax=Oceanisphaera sp. TaxID=1929979 RepID=UPI003C738CB8
IGFNTNTNINATGSTKLATSKEKLLDGKAVNTLNGDLAIGSGVGNLTIDPKNMTLNATGDIILAARGGKLHLKGYAGIKGLGSEKVVKLTTGGDISLSGKAVFIEGSDLSSKVNGINITATDGSVELKGVKNSFTNYVSPQKVKDIEQQIVAVNSELKKYDADIKILKEGHDLSQIISGIFQGVGSSNSLSYFIPMYQKLVSSPEYKQAQQNAAVIDQLKEQSEDLKPILETSKKASTGFEHKASALTAGKDINITAKQGVLIEGADLTSSNGGITILSEGNLAATTIIGTDPTTNLSKSNINNDSIRITGLADIYQQGNISNGTVTGPNYSYHQLVNQPKLTAKGNITIAAQGKLAKASDTYNTTSKTYTTNNAVILNSADVISTGGNVRIDAALGDINLEASQAAFIEGSQTTSTSRKWYGKKKTTTTTKTSNNSNAVTTDIQANNISLTADGNINIYGSDLTAAPTGNIKLTAGKLLNLYAIDNVNESSTDVRKKSSFLGVRYNKDHNNDTRQELSQLPAKLIGGKAYTASGGNTLLVGTVFNTLKPADIKVGVGAYADANAKLILDNITTQITTTHNQERESTVWMKTVDQGSVVTSAALPKFNQSPTITSANGVVVAVPVEVTVDSNAKAKAAIQKSQEELGKIALNLSKQPGYEYLATLDKANDINWAQVDLIQKNWNYTQEGLTPGAAALIAIAITIAAGPAGTGLSASMIATNAAGIALQTQAVITLINNKGDISKTLKDMASSDTIRNMATAALTAGVGAKLGLGSSATDSFGQKLANGVGTGLTQAVADAVINGVSFEEALKNSLRSSLVDVFAASIFTGTVKPIDTDDFARNLAHKLVAAGIGCASASAKQQSCDAGALGAAVGEMLGDYLVDDPSKLTSKQTTDILNAAKLLAGSVALLANVDVNVAADIAGIAVENNALKIKKLPWAKVGDDAYKLVREDIIPRNSGLAGKQHPVSDIWFTSEGYPIFTDYIYKVSG